MNGKPLFWIIGGGLLQIPLAKEVKDLGYATLVTDADSGCPCRKSADLFHAIDIFVVPEHLLLAETLLQDGHVIKAVLAAGIDAPETAARLCQKLRLPGVDPEIARLVNHKDKFREKLRILGYPVPKFAVISSETLDSIESAVDRIGYPLIVKNTSSSGSRGTQFFHAPDPHGIRDAVGKAIAVSRSKLALIESVWEGSEHTVETLFDCDGRFHPCFITDRYFDKKDGYAIETGLRHPSALSESEQNALYDLAYRVAHDLGVSIGAAKYDMMLTKDGPRIIEMTVRLSGGFDCQYLVPAATGKNILKAAALTALGESFDATLLQDKKGRVALSGSLWPKPGKIKSIKGVEETRKIGGLEHLFFRNQVGDTVVPYTDCTKRVCFYIVSGQTEAEAKADVARLQQILTIETEPA